MFPWWTLALSILICMTMVPGKTSLIYTGQNLRKMKSLNFDLWYCENLFSTLKQ